MNELSKLISDLQTAVAGSLDFDERIAKALFPDTEIAISRKGRRYFIRPSDNGNSDRKPVPLYSRSLDAKLPGEEVVRVEKIQRRVSDRWRAWLSNDWSADASTEILARRLARLTYIEFERSKKGAKIRKTYDGRTGEQRALDRDSKLARIAAARASEDPAEHFITEENEVNYKLIIDALCAQIRDLQSGTQPSIQSPSIFPDDSAGDSTIVVKPDPRFHPVVTTTGTGSSVTLSDALDAWKIEARPRVKSLERVAFLPHIVLGILPVGDGPALGHHPRV